MISSANTEIFEKLINIDIENDFDHGMLLFELCGTGNFELINHLIWKTKTINFGYTSPEGKSIFQALLFKVFDEKTNENANFDNIRLKMNKGFDDFILLAENQLGKDALDTLLQKPSEKNGRTLFHYTSRDSEYISQALTPFFRWIYFLCRVPDSDKNHFVKKCPGNSITSLVPPRVSGRRFK